MSKPAVILKWTGALLITVAAAAVTTLTLRGGKSEAKSSLPTAIARKSDFQVIVPCRGELVAARSYLIVAPNAPNLQLVWMATPGQAVKQGDVILRFDSSGAKRQLQEKDAALNQATAQVAESQAQAGISEEQLVLELSKLRTEAERARLEVSKAEILSKIQAEEKQIDYVLAQEKLQVKEAELNLLRAQNQSKIAGFQSTVKKNQDEVDLTTSRISRMEVKAPLDGVVNYLTNFSQGWVNAKPFKVGDNVWPGSSIAEIPDLSSLRMKAKVEEIERGRLKIGGFARIAVDPFPEKNFEGKLESVSALTEQNFEWPPSRNFRAYGAFAAIDPRLRPGMNGRLDIVVDKIAGAISVPVKAVFSRGGRPIVLVPGKEGLKPTPVEILARNPDEIAVKGISEGTVVSLVEEPSGEKKKGA